jgi:hypothetical protein
VRVLEEFARLQPKFEPWCWLDLNSVKRFPRSVPLMGRPAGRQKSRCRDCENFSIEQTQSGERCLSQKCLKAAKRKMYESLARLTSKFSKTFH